MPQFTTHVTGLGFPEGPVPGVDGEIYFTDLRHQCVYRWSETMGLDKLATVGGAPNGMRRGPDGHLYVANNGGVWPTEEHGIALAAPQVAGTIQRFDRGTLTDIVRSVDGEGPLRPNDLVFAPDGRVVFTDPRNWEVLPNRTKYETGRIFAARLGDEPVEIARVEGFPNGLTFLPDGSLLVGLTEDKALLRFEWTDGTEQLQQPQLWAELDPSIGADGIIVVDDKLVVAGSVSDSLHIFDMSGALVDEWYIGHDSDPTNLCVAYGRLWVTCGYGESLISTEWPAA